MATTKRTTSGLGIYVDLSRVIKGSEVAEVALEDMHSALIYWCSSSNNFLLSKKAALHLTDYLKLQLASQEIMIGMPSLTEDWQKTKAKEGLNPQIGIATGKMHDSIKVLDSGYGKYKVGVSEREKAPLIQYKSGRTALLGSFKKVYEYANVLEFGSSKQQARPWFFRAVNKWVHRHAPTISDPFLKQFNAPFQKLHRALYCKGPTPKVKATDIIRYTGE